jgi:hypothetical protein
MEGRARASENEGKEKLTNGQPKFLDMSRRVRSAKLCGHLEFMPCGTFRMVDDLGVSNHIPALYRRVTGKLSGFSWEYIGTALAIGEEDRRMSITRHHRFDLSGKGNAILAIRSHWLISDHHLVSKLTVYFSSPPMSAYNQSSRNSLPFREGALGPAEIRRECPQFRVLVIGKANAGKTTILRKVCNAKPDAKPIVYDGEGRKLIVDDAEGKKVKLADVCHADL